MHLDCPGKEQQTGVSQNVRGPTVMIWAKGPEMESSDLLEGQQPTFWGYFVDNELLGGMVAPCRRSVGFPG